MKPNNVKLQSKSVKKRARTRCWWHASSVCVITQLEAISTKKLVSLEVGGHRALKPLRFRWNSDQASCSFLKRKPFNVSRSSHLVKFFFQKLHILLVFKSMLSNTHGDS